MISLPFGIALKYFRSKRGGFISFVSVVAFLGIALGVSVLIVVSSVMNGFERELRDRILQSIPHASINGPIKIEEISGIQSILEKNSHVIASSPFIETQGLISSEYSLKGVYLFGIFPETEKNVSLIDERLVEGNLNNLKSDEYGIFIGDILSIQLDLQLGDYVSILVPDTNSGIAGVFPRTKKFKVVGIFNIGSPEIDQSYIYLHISNAAKLLRMGDVIHGIRIKYDNIFLAEEQIFKDENRINKILDKYYTSSNWTSSYGTLFQAIKMEKFLVSLLLSIIILVAVFNTVSMLVMTINEKKGQIAILITLGGTKKFIQRIFLFFGSLIGISGTLFGLIFGILVTKFLGQIIRFLEEILNMKFLEVYFIDYFPIDIRINWILFICFISVALTILASLYPARLASKIEPAEVLRYE